VKLINKIFSSFAEVRALQRHKHAATVLGGSGLIMKLEELKSLAAISNPAVLTSTSRLFRHHPLRQPRKSPQTANCTHKPTASFRT
jgi:hypothetical protein